MMKTPPKNKGGRPKKVPVKVGRKKGQTKIALNPDIVRKLVEVFLIDYTDEEACDHAGIGHTAFYEELKRNPKFAEEIARAKRGLNKSAKRVLATHIIKHESLSAATFQLKHRQSEQYRTKSDIEGAGGWMAVPVLNPDGENHPRIVRDEEL